MARVSFFKKKKKNKKEKNEKENKKEEQKLDQVQALVAIYGSGNLTAPQGRTLARAQAGQVF